MNDKTILVIDDSATIRKLVDTNLSPLGYHVVLAPTAEDGLRLASEVRPHMILLDHQLPGTTGFEVCTQLSSSEETRLIPVVISSTLRNRAYAEYSELPNVVDMLPKPYTPELLVTTISNALDTGALVVQSQSQGTAVPEVINAVGETDLHGSLQQFALREVLDFLNNGDKSGILEVEAGSTRVWFYLDKGRLQGVSANKIDQDELLAFLPDSLRELAPVLNLTSAGGSCAQVEGLVQLLDRKVLDPRLLGKLLRYQAALLVFRCFTNKLDSFRFESGKPAPPLVKRLPLDISLLALLVDGAMQCDESHLPDAGNSVFARRAIRGQNLDRTGLSARHMKLLGMLSEPRGTDDLARGSGWEPIEVRRVVFGFMLAELVQRQTKTHTWQVIALETDAESAQQLRQLFADAKVVGKVVRDRVALQLALRRIRPEVILVSQASGEACRLANEAQRSRDSRIAGAKWVALSSEHHAQNGDRMAFTLDTTIKRPTSANQLSAALRGVLEDAAQRPPSPIRDSSVESSRTDSRVLQGAL